MSFNKTNFVNSFYKSCQSVYKLDDVNKSENKNHQGSLLSLLLKNNNIRNDSLKTFNFSKYKRFSLDYNINELKRFDELNNSMSDISDFDLENDKNDNISEFNSSDDNFSELEEIKIKSRIVSKKRNSDCEFYKDLEKEYENILKELKIKP